MLTTLTEIIMGGYMVSRVAQVCDAYESGIGHGMKNDGLPAPYNDVELIEAYQIGYKMGQIKLEDYEDNND